ncbi:Uncharacterised protein [Metamycoplasma alkalescens]|uniref:Uncharacterized protein n=1 Tax=Metamycoplasma alkalescens TaxID=45363 RepID=A0A3B0NZJ1_9BACT|nr:Uncharacterised protein [Metamycoplasma alkalescens]
MSYVIPFASGARERLDIIIITITDNTYGVICNSGEYGTNSVINAPDEKESAYKNENTNETPVIIKIFHCPIIIIESAK